VAITFDGPNKLIRLDAATTSITATQIYSRWKDFVATSDNSKYLQAFTTVGGDPLGNDVFITPYFFLMNSWKVRPYPQNYQLTISENFLTEDNSSPFSFPPGGYAIEVVRQFALKTETVDGSGDPFATELESSITREQALRIMLSVLAGSATGMTSATTLFKSVDGSKDRVSATLDEGGNRTITARDGS